MSAADRETTFVAADGWSLGALLRPAGGGAAAPGVVMVPGSRHERDAWTTVADALHERGLASLRLDVRGRGTSKGSVTYDRMGPVERRRVVDDVSAALDHVARHDGVDADRLAVVTEQDTSPDAVEAAAADERVRAVVVVSGRSPRRLTAALERIELPVLGMVSTEDRLGLRATVDAYLAGADEGSRLEVFRGLGVGITMASVRQFEEPDAEPIESIIASWLVDRLT